MRLTGQGAPCPPDAGWAAGPGPWRLKSYTEGSSQHRVGTDSESQVPAILLALVCPLLAPVGVRPQSPPAGMSQGQLLPPADSCTGKLTAGETAAKDCSQELKVTSHRILVSNVQLITDTRQCAARSGSALHASSSREKPVNPVTAGSGWRRRGRSRERRL